MIGEPVNSEFRLGRLRFIRLPPTSISFPVEKSKCDSTAFELGIGVTDDYGTDIDLFESINLRLQVSAVTGEQSIDGIALSFATEERSKATTLKPFVDFTFVPSRGPFLKLSLKLVSLSPKLPIPPRVRFKLSVAPNPRASVQLENTATKRIREIIGEVTQGVLETWDDNRYVFLSVESGEVGLIRKSQTTNSAQKVQTTLRHIQVPCMSSVTIVERPGLNNSTGQRLWDCAIGISTFFSLHGAEIFNTEIPVPDATRACNADEAPSRTNKRRKITRRTRVVELGAGCGLASLVTNQIVQTSKDEQEEEEEASVIATDIEATVETTLLENLGFNNCGSQVKRQVLDWGLLTERQIRCLIGVDAEGTSAATALPATNLTLVATDVLYNPESHELLLDVLLSFLRPRPSVAPMLRDVSSRALIAYKRRTEGDDGFFELAKAVGLDTRKIWEWGEVSVWSFT